MKRTFTLSCILLIIYCFSNQAFAESEEKYDPIQTALALNYAQMSICRIVTYNDRVVLDQEYDNIINNINLKKIKDEEIMNLLQSLMDSLTESKLVAGDKEWLVKDYEKKVEKAVYDSFSNGAGLAAGAATAALTGNFAGAANNLTQVGMQYFNYQKMLEDQKDQLEKSKWELEKETIEFLNYQRKKMLRTSWELIQRYDLPDEWRLTEKQINDYIEILKDDQIDRKLRKLKRIESEFQAYPPYWYYYGKTAQENSKPEMALKFYNKYEEVRKGIFRSDPFFSSACMNRIALLDYDKDKDEILRNLEIITEQSKDDNNLTMFCALSYMRCNEYEKAKKLFQKNIDEEFQVSLNKRLFGEALLAQKSSDNVEKLISEMSENDSVKNQDILYLIGQARQIDLLKKIEKQISSIELSIDSNMISKADIIVKIPIKWFFEDLEVSLKYGGQIWKPVSLKADEKEKAVFCVFDSVIDEDSLIENNGFAQFVVSLIHPSYPMDIVFSADVKKASVDTLKGKVSENKYTPEWVKNKLEATKMANKKIVKKLNIVIKEIKCSDKTYTVENGLIANK